MYFYLIGMAHIDRARNDRIYWIFYKLSAYAAKVSQFVNVIP